MISKQTNRPMVPFLCDTLCQVIKALMRRFVKKDVLNATSDELDVTDSKNHVDYKRVDYGFASEKLKGTAAGKPSEREVMDF